MPQLYRLTYQTRFSRDERKDISLLSSPDEKQPILGSQVKYHAKSGEYDKETIETPFLEKAAENTDEYEIVQSPDDAVEDPEELKQIAGGMLGQDHTDSDENLQSQKARQKFSCWWTFIFWFCGISDLEKGYEKTSASIEEETKREEKHMDKILEEPMSRFLLATFLGFVACAYLFLYLYYA